MMNETPRLAILHAASRQDRTVRLYGLTVLERTLHALHRSGVGTVWVHPDALAAAEELIRRESMSMTCRAVGPDLPADLRSHPGHLVLLPVPVLLDPAVLSDAFRSADQAGKDAPLQIAPNAELTLVPTGRKNDLPDILSWPGGRQTEADATENRLATWPAVELNPAGRLLMAVPTEADLDPAREALVRSLTKPTDGWVSRHLNRPLSTRISRLLAHTSVTPNQFTLLTGLVGLATGVFAAQGGYWNFLAAGTLFHLTSVLDGVDGELARLKFKYSPKGQWLDTVVDNLSYVAALMGILVGIFRTGVTLPVKVAGILALVFVVAALGSLYLYLLRFKSGGTLLNVKYGFQEGNSRFDRTMQVLAAFGKRDLFALLFFLLGVAGQLPMALGYVAVMAAFVFGFSIQAHRLAAKAAKRNA
ncbi:MAG: hypothetical protein RLY31_2401 [Bacteroidota bacterium]|jgi:phosphatidylglycerophosphate synthase